jgi:hypothetical protein
MPGGDPGGAGAGGDEDGGVGDECVDLAEKVTCQVDTVRRQVAKHAAATPLPLITPGQSSVGVGGVIAEQADPGVGDVADLAGGDQLPGQDDGRRVAIVETHRGVDRGLAHRLAHGPGVGGGQPDRLFDPDVLAGLRHRDADLAVQEVRRGDRHRPHPWIAGHLAPVLDGGGETVPCGGVGSAARNVVGHGHQIRSHLREVVGNAQIRLGVHPPHPAEPHDGHAGLACHP